MVERADAVGTEDAFIPGAVRLFLEIGLLLFNPMTVDNAYHARDSERLDTANLRW